MTDITRDESGMYKTSHGIFKLNSRDSEKRGDYVSAFLTLAKCLIDLFFIIFKSSTTKGNLLFYKC